MCVVVRALCVWLVCVAARAHPLGRAQDALLAPKVVRLRDKQDEPSCEQLKAMWRFSKRQARAPEIINDIPSYRDPFTYNVWPAYTAPLPRFRDSYTARPTFPGPYGRVVHKAPPGHGRITSNYDDARMYGVLSDGSRAPMSVLRYSGRGRAPAGAASPPQHGSFQHLKELIRTERARELQAQRAAEQRAARAAALKDIAAGARRREDGRGVYSEQEPRRLQELELPVSDDPQPRRQRPTAGRQYGRYSDLVPIPERRALAPVPLYALDEYPDSLADLMTAYF